MKNHTQPEQTPQEASATPQQDTRAEQQLAEYKNLLQRLQAEFENFQKRTAKEQQQFKAHATAELLKELLNITDDFELAMHNKESDAFRNGIELIYAKLNTFLEKQGVKKIPTNKNFDPNYHEALLQEPSDKPEGTILQELQSGYTIHDKVLRPSKVKISTGGKP